MFSLQSFSASGCCNLFWLFRTLPHFVARVLWYVVGVLFFHHLLLFPIWIFLAIHLMYLVKKKLTNTVKQLAVNCSHSHLHHSNGQDLWPVSPLISRQVLGVVGCLVTLYLPTGKDGKAFLTLCSMYRIRIWIVYGFKISLSLHSWSSSSWNCLIFCWTSLNYLLPYVISIIT